MKRRVAPLVAVLMVGCTIFNMLCSKMIYAGTRVSNFATLEEMLEQTGSRQIQLTANILLEDEIAVQGKKTIIGNGHTLFRGENNVGHLFQIEGAELLIENVCISGGEIKQKWITTSFFIRKNGRLIMDGGELSGHWNEAGGPAVRVESGGMFEIRSGTIKNNKAIATGSTEGQDARGGAISNWGKVVFSGGVLEHNEARGYVEKTVTYGGLGGMLYNQGECILKGAEIKRNKATVGVDIYHDTNGLFRQENRKKTSTEKKSQKIVTKKKEKKIRKKEEEKKVKKEKIRQAAPRFLFLWEVKNYEEKDWQKELEKGEEILKGGRAVWRWNGLLKNAKGFYRVEAVTKEEEKVIIPVTIVPGTEDSGTTDSYIRFIEPGKQKGENEVILWKFSSEDIRTIKKYLRNQNILKGRNL